MGRLPKRDASGAVIKRGRGRPAKRFTSSQNGAGSSRGVARKGGVKWHEQIKKQSAVAKNGNGAEKEDASSPEPTMEEPSDLDLSNSSMHSIESSETSMIEFDPAELKKWKSLVQKEYDRLYKDYDAIVDEDEEGIFEENYKTVMDSMASETDGRFSLDKAHPASKGAKLCHVKAVEKGGRNGGKAAIRTMHNVRQIPKMCTWLSTTQNISEEDQRTLTHIPFDDECAEPSDEFVRELMSWYDYHVHGKVEGFLNDQLMFQLFSALEVQHRANEGKNSSGPEANLPNVAFKALSEVFPDKGAWTDIQKGRLDLNQRFKPEEVEKGMADAMIPSMDGPDAISATRDRCIHSFNSLWCSRCFQYDCFLHGPDVHPPVKKKKREELEAEYRKDFPRVPCDADCWLISDFSTSPTKEKNGIKSDDHPVLNRSHSECSSPTASPSRKRRGSPRSVLEGGPRNIFDALDVSVYDKKDAVCWRPSEMSMFRVYRGAYGDDYCAIAEGLQTLGFRPSKTCREVREFALKEGPVSPNDTCLSPSPHKSRKKSKNPHQDMHRRFRSMKWTAEEEQGQVTNKLPYTPCSHPGFPCSPEVCTCASRQVLCMKFCHCSSTCGKRFPGCRCKAHCNTKQCPCFMAYRECDPDLCGPCGASDLTATNINCCNVSIQRGLGKHLLLAPSEVAGWGCFVKEAVAKNGFVSEYCGELISQEEADRRGKLYDRRKISYLFNINQEQVVDATRKGNKIRFANHSINPNCYAKVLMVNGDHRIGIFARQNIEAGEELFFDYRYRPGDKLKFVSIERATCKL